MTVRRRRPAGAWQDADNAARYHEFTRAFPMYRDTSRDLVERLDLDPAATVLDLCCGTGATTEELLKVLGVQSPGRTHHDRMAILDAAFERLGDAPPPKSRWLVVVAEAR